MPPSASVAGAPRAHPAEPSQPTAPRGSRRSVPAASPRERARDARRLALLEAAESVFAERGFAGATMAEIARRAGYSAGNLYNVFESKEALFSEVLTARGDQVLEQVRSALASSDRLAEIVDHYVDATLEQVERHRGFMVMLTHTSLDFDWHAASGQTRDLRAELDDQLERVFERAIASGQIASASPRSLASLLQGTLNAYTARWVRNGGDHEELWGPADDLRRLLRRGLGLIC